MRTLTVAALAALALSLAGCVTQTARRSNPAFDDRCNNAAQNVLEGIRQVREYGPNATGVANFMFFLNKDKTQARLESSLDAAISLCMGSAAASPPILAVSYTRLVETMTETRRLLPKLIMVKGLEAMQYSCQDGRRIKEFGGSCVNSTYY